jgi:hypothetical protein
MLPDADTPLRRQSDYVASVHRAPSWRPLQGQPDADVVAAAEALICQAGLSRDVQSGIPGHPGRT